MPCLCSGPLGLHVGFVLLWYSVACNVESLSLFYLLSIDLLVCARRCCVSKLGFFHANQTSMFLIHIRIKGEVGAINHV